MERTRGNSYGNVVPLTIMEQLGGQRFKVMTGCKAVVGDGNALNVHLPRNRIVRIELTGNDYYNMSEGRVYSPLQQVRGGHEPIEWGRMYRDISADALRSTFTLLTGLDCTL